MLNLSGGEARGIADGINVGGGVVVGGSSVLVGITEGVKLGNVVTVTTGAGVAPPQAAKLIVIMKIKSKLDNQCDVFITHPKSNR
jgi:hypothetical protein